MKIKKVYKALTENKPLLAQELLNKIELQNKIDKMKVLDLRYLSTHVENKQIYYACNMELYYFEETYKDVFELFDDYTKAPVPFELVRKIQRPKGKLKLHRSLIKFLTGEDA